MPETLLSRAKASFLGLAAGNMLGLPNEFANASRPDPVSDIHLSELSRPWDDDLAQAVELARSLASLRRADPKDLARRLTNWLDTNGRGCGNQTGAVIRLFRKGFAPLDASRQIWERSNCSAAGNGAVMRCAPAGLAFHDDPAALARAALDSAAVTHFDPRCTQGALAVAAGVAALLAGRPALDAALAAVRAQPKPESELLRALESSATARLAELPIRSDASGYTVLCTKVGFCALAQPGTLESVLLAVVNEGGDADTNGAVAGALLGAKYGIEALPKRWLDRIRGRAEIEALAEELAKR